jgi:hypothetical protein
MMEAWRPLLFADEDLNAKKTRDPVAPAKRSKEALHKISSKELEDGTKVHSFKTLLKELSTIVRNTCSCKNSESKSPTFTMDTNSSKEQTKAFELLETIHL